MCDCYEEGIVLLELCIVHTATCVTAPLHETVVSCRHAEHDFGAGTSQGFRYRYSRVLSVGLACRG
jgi:hypothetical protein